MKNNCNKHTKNKQLSATLIGSTAVIMWSTLALLTSFVNNIPPFQLTAMAFSIASIIGTVILITNGFKLSFKLEFAAGYLSALTAALLWALYSVLSRK